MAGNNIMEKRNLELLRPFDLEAAKGGALLCDFDLKIALATQPLSLVAVVGKDGYHAVRDADGNLWIENAANLRMRPLCWVEGKPVYPGDTLYYAEDQGKFIAKKRLDDESIFGHSFFDDGDEYTEDISFEKIKHLTWEAPRKPLCEVEGKPVFEGDVLYVKSSGAKHVAHRVEKNPFCKVALYDAEGFWTNPPKLTWTPPKVKREGWVNLYPPRADWNKAAGVSHAHATKEAADRDQDYDCRGFSGRIACVRIEWEEPAE